MASSENMWLEKTIVFVGCIELLCYFLFLLVDISIMSIDNTESCDKNLSQWLIFNDISWGIYVLCVFILLTPKFCKYILACPGVVAIITYICILLWGFVMFLDTNNCSFLISDEYNLVLSHLVIQSCFVVLKLISIMIGTCLAYICPNDKKSYERI